MKLGKNQNLLSICNTQTWVIPKHCHTQNLRKYPNTILGKNVTRRILSINVSKDAAYSL